MHIHSLIIDDFLDNSESFRQYAVKQSYDGIVNPQDNVLYPDITIKIPEDIALEIKTKTLLAMGPTVSDNAIIRPQVTFMRMSKKGVHVPHQAHTDKNIADYTLLLYLNKDEDCQGGTDIVEHISGMNIHPQDQDEIDLWKRDTNIPEQWIKTGFCPMKFNRAFILRSDLFHRAQPIGGFGQDNKNSRLVLTMFYNIEE